MEQTTINIANITFGEYMLLDETAKSDYAKTKYPILRVHGWLGWSRIGNDSFNIDYWYHKIIDL